MSTCMDPLLDIVGEEEDVESREWFIRKIGKPKPTPEVGDGLHGGLR